MDDHNPSSLKKNLSRRFINLFTGSSPSARRRGDCATVRLYTKRRRVGAAFQPTAGRCSERAFSDCELRTANGGAGHSEHGGALLVVAHQEFFEALAARAAELQFRAVLEDDDILAVGVLVKLFDAVEVDDRGAVDEIGRAHVELLFEFVHAHAQ